MSVSCPDCGGRGLVIGDEGNWITCIGCFGPQLNEPASRPLSDSDRQAALSAMRGMLAEFEKMTRYGSPLAHAANENVLRCRAAIAKLEESK